MLFSLIKRKSGNAVHFRYIRQKGLLVKQKKKEIKQKNDKTHKRLW